jgi:hypothetical protein
MAFWRRGLALIAFNPGTLGIALLYLEPLRRSLKRAGVRTHNRNLPGYEAAAIASALKVSVGWLFGEVPPL